MSTIRKRGEKWQSIIRISGHPDIAKSFVSKTDAKRWATLTETKLRRDDAGISSIKFPKFDDIARRYTAITVTVNYFHDLPEVKRINIY